MGLGTGLQARLVEWMRRTKPLATPMYLRTIAESGEDRTLGTRGTPTVTDTPVVPDPWVTNVSYKDIEASGGKLTWGDYAVLMPPTYTKAQVQAALGVIDGQVFYPYQVTEMLLDGARIWFRVLYSRKKTAGQQVA